MESSQFSVKWNRGCVVDCFRGVRKIVRGKSRTLRNNMVSRDFRRECRKKMAFLWDMGVREKASCYFILAWEVGQSGENEHEGNKSLQEMWRWTKKDEMEVNQSSSFFSLARFLVFSLLTFSLDPGEDVMCWSVSSLVFALCWAHKTQIIPKPRNGWGVAVCQTALWWGWGGKIYQ